MLIGIRLVSQLSIWLLILLSNVQAQQETKYVEIRWVDIKVAAVELQLNNFPVVSLPKALEESIRKHFPRYRIPESADYDGSWAEYYDYLSPEEREGKVAVPPDHLTSRKVPFLALGDFNHDGFQDVTLFLIDKRKTDLWKLVVFHGSQSQYSPMVVRSAPKGSGHISYLTNVGVSQESLCSDGHECFEFYVFESSSFEYVWKNGKYFEVRASD